MNAIKLILPVAALVSACRSHPSVEAPTANHDNIISIDEWDSIKGSTNRIVSVEGYVTQFGQCDYLVARQFVGKSQFDQTPKIYLPDFPFILSEHQGFARCTITGELDTTMATPGPMFVTITNIRFPEKTDSHEMERFVGGLKKSSNSTYDKSNDTEPHRSK